MRRLLAGLLVMLGLLAGVLAVSAFSTRREPAPPFGAEVSLTQARSAPSTPSAPLTRSTPSTPSGSQPAQPSLPTAAARVAFEPTRITLAALGIAAAVDPSFSVQGQLQPPVDPGRVGWWQGSRLANSTAGSTVLVGHVDSATAGLGALYRLSQVRPGMAIRLTAGREASAYRVVSLQYVTKSGGLPTSLFAAGGPARLVLITCGGSFDTATKSYRDNVIVTAAPVTG